MTVKEYVSEVLCVPVTRIGHLYITEAIELVLDVHEHKFYLRLANIHNTTPRYLEKAMRDAKNLSLKYMPVESKQVIFGAETPMTSEYVVKAAEYYRRTYENKE